MYPSHISDWEIKRENVNVCVNVYIRDRKERERMCMRVQVYVLHKAADDAGLNVAGVLRGCICVYVRCGHDLLCGGV